MATDDSEAEALGALVAALCPGFRRREGWFRRSVKCHLVAGWLGERAVVAKRVVRPLPLWRWYLHREAALLEAFERSPPPARWARRVAFHPERDLLLVDHIDGSALATTRRAPGVSLEALRALIAAQRALACWTPETGAVPSGAPPPEARREQRSRLLEDPTDPLGWCLEGLARGASLGLLASTDAARAQAALRAWPRVRFSHGDLLLRNVLQGAQGLTLVDWECAGPHPEGWDLALLWPAVGDEGRALLEAVWDEQGAPARRAYDACVLFALVRELKFKGRGEVGELARWREEVAARLR
ncbi:MAG: phosphotransferase [Deltaproteobacteria bacterium]|nr:phosphotransferase [Deltaproteobacteria bacterium]